MYNAGARCKMCTGDLFSNEKSVTGNYRMMPFFYNGAVLIARDKFFVLMKKCSGSLDERLTSGLEMRERLR